MKLCINCLHYQAPPGNLDPAKFSTCGAFPRDVAPNLVTGEPAPISYRYCDQIRQDEGACGPGGLCWIERLAEVA
jgi:hypothetical protein